MPMRIKDVLSPRLTWRSTFPPPTRPDSSRSLPAAPQRSSICRRPPYTTRSPSATRLGSTGIGHGVSIPHARLCDVKRVFGFLARLKSPIEFDAIDEHRSTSSSSCSCPRHPNSTSSMPWLPGERLWIGIQILTAQMTPYQGLSMLIGALDPRRILTPSQRSHSAMPPLCRHRTRATGRRLCGLDVRHKREERRDKRATSQRKPAERAISPQGSLASSLCSIDCAADLLDDR